MRLFLLTAGISVLFLGSACFPATELDQNPGPETLARVSGDCPQDRQTPMAPPGVYNLTNPLRPTDDNIRAGQRSFQTTQPLACTLCHGERGDGQGDPNFESDPAASNFTCAQTINALTDGQLFWIIRNGSPNTAMPAYSDIPPNDIWRMIHYLRGFSKTQ